MGNLAVRIALIESEKGWGRKIEDYMVCLTVADAIAYQKEFNSQNTENNTPDWYMQIEGSPEPIDLTNTQFEKLKDKKYIWWSSLKNEI